MNKNKVREQLAEEFIKSLEQNELPWKAGWSKLGRPVNAVTNKPYKGVNAIWLSVNASDKRYNDARWCTYKQAQDKGWQVKKGEKGTSVEFFSFYDKQEKRNITPNEVNRLKEELEPEEFKERVRMVVKNYSVFNAEQIDGIPKLEKPECKINNIDSVIEIRDLVIKNLGLEFHEGGGRAYYTPAEDSITMPLMEAFTDEYSYLSTFLHESGHSTGASHRLDRDLSGGFGSENYAKEELRAEISSAFTSQQLGLINDKQEEYLDNHKAYIQNWCQVIKEDKTELFKAIKDAETISDYLIEKGGLEKYIIKTEDLEQIEDLEEVKEKESLQNKANATAASVSEQKNKTR